MEGGIRSAGTVLSGAPTVHGELGAAVQTSTAGAIDAMLRSGSIADSKSSLLHGSAQSTTRSKTLNSKVPHHGGDRKCCSCKRARGGCSGCCQAIGTGAAAIENARLPPLSCYFILGNEIEENR